MPKVNRYVDIDTVEKEAKKDYIDRHSPFLHCADTAATGELFPVTVRVGHEYAHPDDHDHYIKYVQLWNGQTLLAESYFLAGMLGGDGAKGNAAVTFNVAPTGSKMNLHAMAYCTKHGLWESEPKAVAVEG